MTLVILLPFFSAPAETLLCKGNPQVVDACFVVHGRAEYGNGTPSLRIWIIGTRRKLGVTNAPIADDAYDPIVPRKLRLGPSQQAFGDFEVCPFTPKRQGEMQMVCIQDVKNVLVKANP